MKSTLLFLVVALASSASVYKQEQPVSRFGVIEIRNDEDNLSHRLFLNGKEIFQYEGQSIEIVDVLNGRGLDYLIVGTNSGGIACPTQVVVIEVHKSGDYIVTEDFGSCNPPTKARVVNGRVIIDLPMYIPHPDLLSKKELNRRQRTKEVYTWYRGKLTKKIAPL